MLTMRPALFAAAAITATALSLGGCATKDFVNQQVSAEDVKVQAGQDIEYESGKSSGRQIMAVGVTINCFGRIGRLVLRAAHEAKREDIEIVAINDLGPVATNAHLRC